MEFYPIFPSVIGKVKIEEHELIKKKYAPRIIDQFKTCPNEKAPWANQCNTWQVNADNQLNEVFTKYFEKYLHDWFEEFKFPKIKYKVFMWVNVHNWYGYQDTHTHLGGHTILCGTYSLQLNEHDRPVQFTTEGTYHSLYRNILEQENITEPVHYSLADKSCEFVDITEGDLVLFAPSLRHYVPCATQKHDGHRITLSFNLTKAY